MFVLCGPDLEFVNGPNDGGKAGGIFPKCRRKGIKELKMLQVWRLRSASKRPMHNLRTCVTKLNFKTNECFCFPSVKQTDDAIG